jgi:hypothetical protein
MSTWKDGGNSTDEDWTTRNELARRRREKATKHRRTLRSAKLYQKKRHHEKIQMKKQIKAHEERNVKSSAPNEPSSTPLPQYLLDRSNPTNAKALSSAIKNKRYVLEEIYIILFPTISFFRHGGILLEDWADPTLLERKKLQSSRFLCLRSAGLRKMRCSR